MVGNPGTVPTENIDEVILRLLKIKSGTEIDYQTYFNSIKKRLAAHRMVGAEIPIEEDQLLKEELKRVGKLKDKGRFKVKSKKIKIDTTYNFSGVKRGRSTKTNSIIKYSSGGKISVDKLIPSQSKSENFGNGTEKVSTISKSSSILESINKKLDSIINTLLNLDKESKKEREKRRKETENKKRSGKEKDLETKRFDGIKSALSNIIKPFQSVWDRIVNFITNILIAKVLLKLIDWFAKKENQNKIQSLIRFFKDHWPLLLALYLRFGTGLGRFIGKLGGILIKGAFKLVGLAAKLAVKAGVGKAGGKLSKVAGFFGGKKGKALGTVLGIATDVAVTAGTSVAIDKFVGGGDKKPPVQKFAGGGAVKVPRFAGGGFANFGNMFRGAGLGSMFGPLGMLLGAGLGGVAGSGMFNGLVKGPKGKDKVPAMLSDGEFVMSAGAVRKHGIDTLEAMNAAGGGTNVPKIANNIVHAAGGGFVGNVADAQRLWSEYLSSSAGEQYKRGGKYYQPNDTEIISKHNKEFIKTYVQTGKPPEWANIKAKTTRVRAPESPRSSTYQEPYTRKTQTQRSSSSSWWDDFSSRFSRQSTTQSQPKPPTSSSITKSTGSGALSTEVQSVRPKARGYGGALQAAFAAMEFVDRKNQGQTNAQAGLGAAGSALGGQVGWMAGAKGGALIGGAIGAMFGGVGAAPGAAIGAIIGGVAGGYGGAMLGGKLADDLSGVNAAKEKLSRGGIGGAIKGGYGLKDQSFKDAPKTMVMTDDKGRPFVGHKAMKGGKLTYVRPPTPGTGTRNPLEMLGRAINPGAYKDNDSRVAMKNQRIAMVNSLESFQRQGMSPDAQARMMKQMGGNLKDVQNDLNARKARQTKEASQRNLDRLSNRGGGVRSGGKGVRHIAEMKAQMGEDQKRGGDWGKFTRGLTRMFSDPNSKLGKERLARLDAQDKSSTARVKQRGAESIGRYYSSSDGKYYKDYNAAMRARQARLATQQNRKPAVKPPVKPRPRLVGSGAGGASRPKGGSGSSSPTKPPSFSPTHHKGTRTTQATLGVKK